MLDAVVQAGASAVTAASQSLSQSGWMQRAWCAMAGTGLKAAVTLIHHI